MRTEEPVERRVAAVRDGREARLDSDRQERERRASSGSRPSVRRGSVNSTKPCDCRGCRVLRLLLGRPRRVFTSAVGLLRLTLERGACSTSASLSGPWADRRSGRAGLGGRRRRWVATRLARASRAPRPRGACRDQRVACVVEVGHGCRFRASRRRGSRPSQAAGRAGTPSARRSPPRRASALFVVLYWGCLPFRRPRSGRCVSVTGSRLPADRNSPVARGRARRPR